MPEHSPEPWRADWIQTDEGSGFGITNGELYLIEHGSLDTEKRVAISRIAACVNACRGLNPEVVPELVGMVKKLRMEIVELLDCAITYADPDLLAVGHRGERCKKLTDEARELLARVKR